MSTKTSIAWTDSTWNPVRGCSRVSEGCRNCYAEGIAARFSNPRSPFHLFADRNKPGSKWTGLVRLIPERLNDPLRWRKPRRVFVNSMSDLFHESLSFKDIDQIFTVMVAAPDHTYQILTKRPERMREYFASGRHDNGYGPDRADYHLDQKIWLGVSVEDQPSANKRIPELLRTPAALRFVSYEPALEGIDIRQYLGELDWVIVGGESGHGARPFDITWARASIAQCSMTGVPCFVKQLGARPYPGNLGHGRMPEMALRDGHGADPSEWPEDLRVQEFPKEK